MTSHNEQQRVDVLAVMESFARRTARNCEACVDPAACTSCDLAKPLLKARAAVAELIEKSTQTIAAFESLGNAKSVIANLEARRECENALVAQKAALANVGAAP